MAAVIATLTEDPTSNDATLQGYYGNTLVTFNIDKSSLTTGVMVGGLSYILANQSQMNFLNQHDSPDTVKIEWVPNGIRMLSVEFKST